ncbi:MAG TPA: tail fiber protein [Phnomibacter sp.]|nr:tail fiber protein [Phnomibacter sp.]
MPTEAFLAEIYIAGFSFPPKGFANCSGQLLSISQNTALFSLLGTTYGGNGTTNFQLPDFRGRTPMGVGSGPGLTSRVLGEVGGTEAVTLTINQIPTHTHTLRGVTEAGDVSNPTGAYLANSGTLDPEYNNSTGLTLTPMNSNTIANAGGSQPHFNMQPYLVLNFYIALQGIFPSRP